jgi:hypothetical protein
MGYERRLVEYYSEEHLVVLYSVCCHLLAPREEALDMFYARELVYLYRETDV